MDNSALKYNVLDYDERLEIAREGLDNDITRFISKFMNKGITQYNQANDVLELVFTQGYCYYFAHILKTAFSKGTVCIAAPVSHVVWVYDGIPYDCEGIYLGEAEMFIPEVFCQRYASTTGKDPILGFKHITINKNQPDDKFGSDNARDLMLKYRQFCQEQ